MQENDRQAYCQHYAGGYLQKQAENDESKSYGGNYIKNKNIEVRIKPNTEIDQSKFQENQPDPSRKQKFTRLTYIVLFYEGQVGRSAGQKHKAGRTEMSDPSGEKEQGRGCLQIGWRIRN